MNGLEEMGKLASEMRKKLKEREEDPTDWPPKNWTLKVFESCGFKCAIVQNEHMGNINGYVRLPKTHPLNGKDYDNIDVDVHGGLTFAQRDKTGGWWVGFDTAHGGDYIPGMPSFAREQGKRWTEELVIKETRRLAAQLKRAK